MVNNGKKNTSCPFGEVAHLGWVVRDLEGTVEYCRKIGLGGFEIDRAHRMAGAEFRGRTIDVVVKKAWRTLGGVGLEILQPVKGRSAYDEFLERHGDGIHHLAFAVESIRELQARLEMLAGQGVGVLERGSFETGAGEGVFVYLDTYATGGLAFELLYDPMSLKRKKQGREAPEEACQYPFDRITQYALVVKDLDQVAGFYNRIGVQVGTINRNNQGLNRKYRGRDLDYRMDVGWGSLGSVPLEIIQPTRGRNIYDEYLERHGEGFHHIAFEVEDMDRALALFQSRGLGVSQEGAWGKTGIEGRCAYLDTEPCGGLSLELLWHKKGP